MVRCSGEVWISLGWNAYSAGISYFFFFCFVFFFFVFFFFFFPLCF